MKRWMRSLSQFFVMLVVIALCGSAAPLLSRQAPSGSRLKGIPVRLPLSFEANQGQSDSRVQYLARGPGYTVFLTKEEAVLALKPGAGRARSRGGEDSTHGSQGAVVRIQSVGRNAGAGIEPVERLPGTSNYFIGADPARWRTGIPTYGKVKYEGVYPGIDLVYYGNQRRLECDFIVAPGSDPGTIGLAFQGIDGLDLDSEGDLVLKVKGGEVRMHKPFVYQVVGDRIQEVPGDYVLRHKNQVGFVLAAYDTTTPLVIDPAFTFSTFLGGSEDDSANGIFVDVSGNVYLTGSTESPGFPTEGAYDASYNGSGDAFVTKINAAGTALVYSTFLGGADADVGNSIFVDSLGQAYVTGSTASSGVTGFPTTVGVFQTSNGGSGTADAFVAKLNATGTALVYSTYLGGAEDDVGNSIVVDGSGQAYVTGSTASEAPNPFPTTGGAFQTSNGGSGTTDAFVTKLNATGTAPLMYSTYLGGANADVGNSIFVASGEAYVTGSTQSSGFPTQGAYDTTYNGSGDVFVTKLNAAGTALLYSTFLGGANADAGNSIFVASGEAYVTGSTQSSGFPTTAGARGYGGSGDAFVTKLNAAGTALLYSTFLGGRNRDLGKAITANAFGEAFVAGSTNSPDFPLEAPLAGNDELGGGTGTSTDAFVAKITDSGTMPPVETGISDPGGSGGGGGCFIATASAFEARE